MKFTRSIDIEMNYVSDLLNLLKDNGLSRGSLFTQQSIYGQTHFGREPESPSFHYHPDRSTLEAMERRGIILAVERRLSWSDGSPIDVYNLHAGKIIETTVYSVEIDNFTDYMQKFARCCVR